MLIGMATYEGPATLTLPNGRDVAVEVQLGLRDRLWDGHVVCDTHDTMFDFLRELADLRLPNGDSGTVLIEQFKHDVRGEIAYVTGSGAPPACLLT